MFISKKGAIRAVRNAVVNGSIPTNAKVTLRRVREIAKGSREGSIGWRVWASFEGKRIAITA